MGILDPSNQSNQNSMFGSFCFTFFLGLLVVMFFVGTQFSFDTNFKLIVTECEEKHQVIRLINDEYIAIECKKVSAKVQVIKH